MKRRKFVSAAIASIALPLTSFGKDIDSFQDSEKALYELRTYEIKFGGNQQLLRDYLNTVLGPALLRQGANKFMLFSELGNSNPTKLRFLVAYPNATTYIKGQVLHSESEYISAAMEYNSLPAEKPIYNRYTTSLMLAFDGMPKMMDTIEGASLFELRTYEGYSEDAVRRKIKMFNDGEIDIFLKTGLHPLFFGEMIAGPYQPCLTYMLQFKDMEEHDANWKKFVAHPDWKALSGQEEYANTVSNIRKVFLNPG